MIESRRGMTFIEILACLLVLAMGMLGAIALARYALRLGQESIVASLALPTARSVMADIHHSGAAVQDFATAGGVSKGYVNGLYVQRSVVDSATIGAETFATIKVEVFWSGEGERSLTLQERMVFHAP